MQRIVVRWLYNVDSGDPFISQSKRLETSKLRGWIARRRWVACCAAVRGAIRISKMQDSDIQSSDVRRSSYLGGYLEKSRELMLDESGLAGRWKVAYYQ